MNKIITNKVFLNFLKSKSTPEINYEDSLNEFYKNLELFDQKKIKRIKKKFNRFNYLLGYIQYSLLRYINNNYFKFSELGSSLILLINNQNYSVALNVARMIIEHEAMYLHIFEKIDKNLKNSNFEKILELVISVTTQFNEKYFLKYKRIHVNDAIDTLVKFIYKDTKITKKKANLHIETIYRVLSENVHPAAYSFLIYENTKEDDKKDLYKYNLSLTSSFSQNSEIAQGLFDMIHVAILLINDFPNIVKNSENVVVSKINKICEQRELMKSEQVAYSDALIMKKILKTPI